MRLSGGRKAVGRAQGLFGLVEPPGDGERHHDTGESEHEQEHSGRPVPGREQPCPAGPEGRAEEEDTALHEVIVGIVAAGLEPSRPDPFSRVREMHTGAAERGGGHGRRLPLWLFFGSVAANALLGIAGLVGGGLDGRVLGTSLAVTGALVIALANEPARARRLLRRVPLASTVLGALGFVLVVVSIWWEDGDLTDALLTLLTVATAGTLASVAALARLPERWRALLPATQALLAVCAALVVIALWVDVDADAYWRVTGVVLVVLAALLVSLPVLHRIGRHDDAHAVVATAVAFCPFCGAGLTPADARGDGSTACGTCRCTFRVSLR